MKKVLSTIVLSSLLIAPALALAVEEDVTAPMVFTTQAGLAAKIEAIGNTVFVILLALVGVMAIIAGFLWITAAGDPGGILKARTMLVNSLIGLVVALLAKGIVAVIQNVVGTTTG